MAVAGEAGGVVEVEPVVGEAGLLSAGTLFSTSADMVRREPHWASGRSGEKKTTALRSGAVRSSRQTSPNTHTFFFFFLFVCSTKSEVRQFE